MNKPKKINIALLGVGVAIIAATIYYSDPKTVWEYFRKADPIYILFSVISANIAVYIYYLAWYILLKDEISVREAISIGWASLFLTTVIPTASVSGEILRLYLSRKSGVKLGKSAASIAWHRMLMLAPFLTGFALGLTHLSSGEATIIRNIIVAAFSLLALAIIIILVSTSERYLLKFSNFFSKTLGEKAQGIDQILSEYISSFKAYKEKKLLLLSCLLLGYLSWALNMLPLFLIFKALDMQIPVTLGLFLYSVIVIITIIPFGIPGDAGVRESVMSLTLISFGFEKSISTAVTILASTLSTFLNQTITGLVYFLLKARKIMGELSRIQGLSDLES